MDAQETKLFAALLIAACIVGVILLSFVITIARYHGRNLRLYRENVAAEIQSLEKERWRVAVDLHDQLGPLLSTVKLQASVLAPATDEEREIIQKLKSNIDLIIGDVRRIANNLRPSALRRSGLREAVQYFVETVHETGALDIRLEAGEDIGCLPADVELHCFRLVQEITANVLKHAEARHCLIRMECVHGMLAIQVSDDGKGFDFERMVRESPGLGLQSVANRVELLRGNIEVESGRGKGTIYQIQIPIDYDKRTY